MKSKNDKQKKGKGKKKVEDNSSLFSYMPSEEQIYEIKSSFTKKNIILFCIISSIFLMIFFQYQYERKHQIGYTSDEDSTEEDYYQILGLEPGTDIFTIRKQYKKLAKIWHPDKHPDCKICKEKFAKITDAHEELLKIALAGSYGGGKNNLFTSHPIELTSNNYHRLVEKSLDFWVIFVYEQKRINDGFLEQVASIYNDVALRYQSIIKFGVIDIIKQESLLTYLPYKFPILPSIFTHLTGEENELYQNIDSINSNNLIKFIEDSYASTVHLVQTKQINNFYKTKNTIKPISNSNININRDLDVKFFILSPKNYIDLVVKDFNKRYRDECQIYQNDLGYYDDAMKIFQPPRNQKVYISFNDINKDDNTTYINKILPIPISFRKKDDMTQKLQNAFEIGKKLMMPMIYRNTYLKHCSKKVELISNTDYDDSDEDEYDEDDAEYRIRSKISSALEEDDKNILDLCVIELRDSNDYKLPENNEINKAIYKSLLHNFKQSLSKSKLANKKSSKNGDGKDEYSISINYGYVELKKNPYLMKLYKDYLSTKEKNDDYVNLKGKKFLIINHSNEKFVFKSFTEAKKALHFLYNLDDLDFYEDISFSFEYFNDYDIKDISSLFNEQKIFSIKQILFMSIYAQSQVSYVIMFGIIFLSGVYVLKYDSKKSFVSFYIIFNYFSGLQLMLLEQVCYFILFILE